MRIYIDTGYTTNPLRYVHISIPLVGGIFCSFTSQNAHSYNKISSAKITLDM